MKQPAINIHLTLLLLIPFFSACAVLNESPKYKFQDGVYRTSIPSVSSRKTYVAIEEDSISVYPIIASQKSVVIDSTQKVMLLFPKQRAGSSFNNYVFYKPTLDIDLITIPFKYRPGVAALPHQLNSNVQGAVYAGYRYDLYKLHYSRSPLDIFERKINHYGISVGLFSGFGSAAINPWVTQDHITYEYDGVIWIKGIAGVIAVNNFTVGLALGADHLLDKNNRFWIYQNKPWIGLAFGLNLN